MTIKQFKKSIANTCKSVMSKNSFSYSDIEINNSLPYISVDNIFFQGEEAENLLTEMETTANKTGLNIKTCLVWFLDSCGTFQK